GPSGPRLPSLAPRRGESSLGVVEQAGGALAHAAAEALPAGGGRLLEDVALGLGQLVDLDAGLGQGLHLAVGELTNMGTAAALHGPTFLEEDRLQLGGQAVEPGLVEHDERRLVDVARER